MSQFSVLAADVASVKATAEAHKATSERILRILEGNGQPGLIQITTETKKDLEETQGKLIEVTKDVETLTASVKDLSKVVEKICSDFNKHTAEGNPQHETIIQSFRAKPLQFTLLAIALFLFFVLGITTGFFEHVVAFFKAISP